MQVETDEKSLEARNLQLKGDKAELKAELGESPPVFGKLGNAGAISSCISVVVFHNI